MRGEQYLVKTVHGTGYCGYLDQDIGAVLVILDHFLNTSDLAFHPFKAGKKFLFLFLVSDRQSIAVFGEGDRCRHLFDISQTNGKPIPNGWRLTEDVATELVDVISENYGRECKDIHEALAAVAVDMSG